MLALHFYKVGLSVWSSAWDGDSQVLNPKRCTPKSKEQAENPEGAGERRAVGEGKKNRAKEKQTGSQRGMRHTERGEQKALRWRKGGGGRDAEGRR